MSFLKVCNDLIKSDSISQYARLLQNINIYDSNKKGKNPYIAGAFSTSSVPDFAVEHVIEKAVEIIFVSDNDTTLIQLIN